MAEELQEGPLLIFLDGCTIMIIYFLSEVHYMPIPVSKRLSSAILPTVILFTITILLTSIFVRNLHLVMGQDSEYAAIFAQLQDAELALPIIQILVLSVLFGLLIGCCKKTIPALLLGLAAVIILFVVSLWFTNVNSIRFGIVLQFLLNALRYGVL